ncbi:MAG: thioredoxin [Rhodothalassiaceae bacterium]|nr:MAG: thioredoxin [Rhodothalassiaceae bacterium]
MPQGRRLAAVIALLFAATAAVVLLLYHVRPRPQDAADADAALAALARALPALVVHERPRPLPADLAVAGAEGPVKIFAASGRWRLVNFWATWCGPCVEELPTLDRLQAELGGAGFAVVLVSLDAAPAGEVRAALGGYGVGHLDTLRDPELASMGALAIPGLPTTILVDPRGREVARLVGPAKWDAPAVRDALRRLVGAQS